MAPSETDRLVHAKGLLGGLRVEVVRYNRAGKWWVEVVGGSRQCVTVSAAAKFTRELSNVTVKYGSSGGTTFDRLVRKP